MALIKDYNFKGNINSYWRLGNVQINRKTNKVLFTYDLYKDKSTRTSDISNNIIQTQLEEFDLSSFISLVDSLVKKGYEETKNKDFYNNAIDILE